MKNTKTIIIISFLFIVNSVVFSQTTITLQPGADNGKDARIHSLNTYTTGSASKFVSKAWTYSGTFGIERSLIKFDLSQLPFGTEILSAKLSLYDPNYGDDHHSTISGSNSSVLQRITSIWEENTVTWANQPSTTNVNEVVLAEINENSQDMLDVDVTQLVQDMVDNSNFGFLIKLQTEEHYRSMVFASSDHADPTKHPKLVVTYDVPAEQ